MAKSLIEKMEEAGGIETPAPAANPVEPVAEMPYKKGDYLKPGWMAKPWTGPRPWRKMMNKSTEGSPPFSDKELMQGYRKMGKGLSK